MRHHFCVRCTPALVVWLLLSDHGLIDDAYGLRIDLRYGWTQQKNINFAHSYENVIFFSHGVFIVHVIMLKKMLAHNCCMIIMMMGEFDRYER